MMLVTLPDLSTSKCEYLRLCGEVQLGQNDAPPALVSKREYPSASYQVGGITVYVRVGWSPPNDKKPGHHLHFDFATEGWFDRTGGVPSVDIGMEEVQATIAAVAGAQYDGDIEGTFTVAEGSLPRTVRAIMTGARVEADGVAIELTGGVLSISGGPVKRIRWDKRSDPAGFGLRLTATAPSEVEADFFACSLEAIESAYSALCVGRPQHD